MDLLLQSSILWSPPAVLHANLAFISKCFAVLSSVSFELVMSGEGGIMNKQAPASTLWTLGLSMPHMGMGRPKGTEKSQVDPALEAPLEDQEPRSQGYNPIHQTKSWHPH